MCVRYPHISAEIGTIRRGNFVLLFSLSLDRINIVLLSSVLRETSHAQQWKQILRIPILCFKTGRKGYGERQWERVMSGSYLPGGCGTICLWLLIARSFYDTSLQTWSVEANRRSVPKTCILIGKPFFRNTTTGLGTLFFQTWSAYFCVKGVRQQIETTICRFLSSV